MASTICQTGKKATKPRQAKKIQGQDAGFLKDKLRKDLFTLHQKKRRLGHLREKLKKLEGQDYPAICFGTKKLFRAQFNLKENNYPSHAAWKQEWRAKRSDSSFWLGTHSEPCRNQNAQYHPVTKVMTLRVPYALEDVLGSTIEIKNITFPYGQEDLEKTWLYSREEPNKKGKLVTVRKPLSYRIIEKENRSKEKHFYIQCIFDPEPEECTTSDELGAVGVDFNADHLAVAELDRFGNPINSFSCVFREKDMSTEQAKAVLGDYVADLVSYARTEGKPLVVEDLDFVRKKSGLREKGGKNYRRMLSSFRYKSFLNLVSGRCRKEGVGLIKVNPAFTSVIGYFKYRSCKKFSTHELAAVAIGRRGLNFSEKLTCHGGTLPGADFRLGILGTDSGQFRPSEKDCRHVTDRWFQYRAQIQKAMREDKKTRGQGKRIRVPAGRGSGARESLRFASDATVSVSRAPPSAPGYHCSKGLGGKYPLLLRDANCFHLQI